MIRIGSRGSRLALWQAEFVAGKLRQLGHSVEISIIRTTGDRMQQAPFAAAAARGLFTKEIEEALLAGSIDLAVHSLKDLPTGLDEAFVLGAIPQRADPLDVLVSIRYSSLEDLPPGAVIGTSSLRRQAQLRSMRPDIECVEFRGNVDTRLEKLAAGKADAIILAGAGLERLGQTEHIRQRFSPELLCPAVGQGALAVECRAGDDAIMRALQPLDHEETRVCVMAERECLAALGGGCQMPIGLYCSFTGGDLLLRGVVGAPDGSVMIRGEAREKRTGADEQAIASRLAAQLADELMGQGAPLILNPAERTR